MSEKSVELLNEKCDQASLDKILSLNNETLNKHINKYIELCKPASVYVCDDSDEDKAYIRQKTLDNGEEKSLATEGHTIHFDGPKDQARDKANTKYLLSPGTDLGESLNSVDKSEGFTEVYDFLDGIMEGKEMFILFLCHQLLFYLLPILRHS